MLFKLKNLENYINSKFFFAFFLTAISVLYDVYLFWDKILINPLLYIFIAFMYFLFWLLSLCLGRGITIFFLIFNFIFFCIFKEYNKFYQLPLNIFLFLHSFKEGFSAGIKNASLFFDSGFYIFSIILIGQIYFIFKKSFFNIKKALKVLFNICLVIIFFFSSTLLIKDFHLLRQVCGLFVIQQNIIYKADWLVKYFDEQETQDSTDDIILNSKNLRESLKEDEIKLSFLPKHIYLIQVESFSTKAIDYMPFLSSLLNKKNTFYRVNKNHSSCVGSANSDFMMLTGLNLDCHHVKTAIYSLYPPDIYNFNKPLPLSMKEKGYNTFFLHNYTKKYYSRYRHISKMGFDDIFFEEDFNPDIPRYMWGVDDIVLLKKSFELTQGKEKTFSFIITTGMHTPSTSIPEEFKIKSKYSHEEAYLNASKVFDFAFEKLYTSALDDSLFIIYADHYAPMIDSKDTPVLIIYKGNDNLNIIGEKKEDFNGTVTFINSLFE